MIHVVAGIICNAQQEILVALRPKHALQGNLWEFPGGKIEPSETPLLALRRELEEEIGIQLLEAHFFAQTTHEYPERLVNLEVWWVDSFTGKPHGREGQEIRWLRLATLLTLDFPAANLPIIQAIQQLQIPPTR